MEEKIIVDLGSGSIKAYLVNNRKEVKLIHKKTIMFKVNFSKETGISKEDKNKLMDSLQEIEKEYPDIPIYAYATSIFRIMEKNQLDELFEEIYKNTRVKIKVVDKEQESLYIAKSVDKIKEFNEPYLVFTVGGSSSEFIVCENGKIKEKITVEFAVGDLLNKFPDTANDITKNTFQEIYQYISENFKELPKTKCKYAIFTGCHLTFNKVAGHEMADNDIFVNKNIPKYILTEQYKENTIKLIEKRILEELKERYPQDPKFMDGARVSMTLITYILEKIGAKYIFPTDLNMIDGIVNELFEN